MDHSSKLKYLCVLYWLGGDDHASVVSWAENEIVVNPEPHDRLNDLFLASTESGSLISTIAADQFSFDPSSTEGKPYAKMVLSQHLGRFLNRDLSPIELCRFVWEIDAKYNDISFSSPERKFPDWIGDLWNACDWCDEGWTHSSAGHLVDEARRLLDQISS